MSAATPKAIRLGPADAERYARLRRRMLEEAPWAFSASPDDDVVLARTAEVLGDARNAIVAVEADDGSGELIASAGLRRGEAPKFSHRAMIWGVFVDAGHRGRGLGRAVMTRLLDIARTWPELAYVDLAVSEHSPEAQRLYDSLGFEPWGREPDATYYEGRCYDEIHLTRRL